MYHKNRKGRPSRREQVEAINAASRFYAAAAADQQRAQQHLAKVLTVLPPKRIRRPVDRTVILESAVNDDIYSAFAKRDDVRLWRNNRGVAMYGNKHVAYGVGPRGASDWIGYRKVLITKEHLGRTFAQFVALEAKRPGEKPDENQQAFIDGVNADGGCGGWADSADKAKELLP